MKKIKNIIIVAILLVASAFNFGILTNNFSINNAYAYSCNATTWHKFYLPCGYNGGIGTLVDCDPGGPLTYCKEEPCQ